MVSGDYAVLLREGMSVKRALVFNLVSSAFSFIGMAAGISLGEVLHAALWINALTAGSFIYIALVHLVRFHYYYESFSVDRL